MDSSAQHYVGEVAQKAIIEKDGKVLITHFPRDLVWDLPGGRLNTGEQPKEGLKREVKEELGVDVEVGEPCFTGVVKFEFDSRERYFICFSATLTNPNQEFVLQKEEVEKVMWIGKEEVETAPLFDICRQGLRAYFSQK